MSAPAHIPRSTTLLSLTCVQLVIAVTELGLIAFTQSILDDGELGFFPNFKVLPGAIGVGLTTVCISIIYAVYFLVTTRTLYRAYNKVAALIMAMLGLLMWLATWGMWVNVLTLYGTTVPVPKYSDDGVYEGMTLEFLGYHVSVGLLGAIDALAIIEWLLFVASAVLLFRSRSPRHPLVKETSMSQKDVASGSAV